MDFLIGGLAAVGAGFFTNPLEVLKIRMQLQGELKARGLYVVHYKTMFHAAIVVAKEDGILALQKGLVPALWTQLFLNGLRLGTYQAAHSRGLITDKNNDVVLWRSVIFGCIGGAAGAAAASPLFLVKTHLQSQSTSKIAVGYQHNHSGTLSALNNIFKEHGVKGLYRGVQATIPRAAVGSTFQLTSFTLCKQYMTERNILKDSPLAMSFLASLVGGIAVSLAMTPFDLVTIRIYNQGVDSKGKGLLYTGIFDCVRKIWATEGFLGFYKGLFPNYIRLGPHTVLCLVFWDHLKAIHNDFYRHLDENLQF